MTRSLRRGCRGGLYQPASLRHHGRAAIGYSSAAEPLGTHCGLGRPDWASGKPSSPAASAEPYARRASLRHLGQGGLVSDTLPARRGPDMPLENPVAGRGNFRPHDLSQRQLEAWNTGWARPFIWTAVPRTPPCPPAGPRGPGCSGRWGPCAQVAWPGWTCPQPRDEALLTGSLRRRAGGKLPGW
jgi:hypothetical protein